MKVAKPPRPKGEPTATNLYALRRHFGDATRAPNQIEPPSVPHLRRCLRAGLVEVDGTELVLTEAGVAALSKDGRP